MEYLKTYENFSVGGHKHIMVTSDKQYYVKTNSKHTVTLMRVDKLTIRKLEGLIVTKAIWSADEIQDSLDLKSDLLDIYGDGDGEALKIKIEDGIMYQSEYTEFNLKRMPNLRKRMVDTDTKVFSNKKIGEILNGLTTMRIFIGAFTDEEEMDYVNI